MTQAKRPSFFSPGKEMPATVVDFFANKLNVIRADDDKFRGNCVDCTGQTVLALKKGTSYKPRTIKDEVLILDSDDRTMIKSPTNSDAKVFEEILKETDQKVESEEKFENINPLKRQVDFLNISKIRNLVAFYIMRQETILVCLSNRRAIKFIY